jgi:3-isopropylmalate dehydrogenase
MTRTYKIATYPGDGVGPEIVAEGVKVLRAAAEVAGVNLEFQIFQGGAQYRMKHGVDVEKGGMEAMDSADAIYFGAIGWPGAPWGAGGLIIAKPRWFMDQYVNLRPVKLYPGVSSIAKRVERRENPRRDVVGGELGPQDVDFTIIRENSEGMYSFVEIDWKGSTLAVDKGTIHSSGVTLGGRKRKTARVKVLGNGEQVWPALSLEGEPAGETHLALRVVTRRGAERICRYAYELAKRTGKKRVTCVDKSNVLRVSDGLFRKIFDEVGEGYAGVERDYAYVDAVTQWFFRNPQWYGVAVAENLFGDVLSDMSSVLAGGMGMMPGANIGDKTASFEPIAGSAPKYTGMNIINPIGAILAGKLMLQWLGGLLRTPADARGGDERCLRAADLVDRAVAEVLREGSVRTYDLGGSSSTAQVGDAVAGRVRRLGGS